MARRIVPWLPWLLAEAVLAFLQSRLWPAGGLLFLIVWTAVLLLYRAAAVQLSSRRLRVLFDVAFAGLCVLAAFEGGWYLLPSVIAFAACDAAGLSIRLPSLPPDREGHELGAALAGMALGWLGLAVAISGPLDATASAVADANGVVARTGPQLGLLQTGASPPVAALLAALVIGFLLLPAATALDLRGRPGGAWPVVAAVAAALTLLAALGFPEFGVSTAPGVALALLAAWMARRRQSDVRPI